MSALDTVATVASLGGAGGFAQVALRMIGMGNTFLTSLIREKRTQAREDAEEELSAWGTIAKATENVRGVGSNWVYRMFAVAAVVVLLCSVCVPLFWDVTIEWYYPKIGYNLFVFQKEKMEIFTIGDGSKTIAILPFQVSFCSNVVWFYMCGKPLKNR